MRRRKRLHKKHKNVFAKLEKIVNNTHACSTDKQTSSKPHVFHKEYCGSVFTDDNDVEIFTDGYSKFESLFNDLKAAKNNIHVQYFTIHNDEIGREVINILIDKVREGVEVKLLYDSVGCLGTLGQIPLRKLKKSGAKVSMIRPHALDINYRNHRKIVVIDGKIGYTGGMNLGAKYKYGIKNKPWRDTHLRIIGRAVHYLQQTFLSDWITSAKGSGIDFAYEMEHYFPKPDIKGDFGAQIVSNGLYNNYKNNDMINLSYSYLISQAKKRVWIQTPYFVPTELMMQTLKTLASSGADVRIMISSLYVSGALFHQSITNYYLSYLVGNGVKVFKYNGVMHAKTMLIDDSALCIGSVNINVRSLERDDELYAYFESPELATKYQKIFLNDLENSVELDYANLLNPHSLSRPVESIMSFFSSLS